MQLNKFKNMTLFWKTYFLNIALIGAVFAGLLLVAWFILPNLSQERNKEITDQTSERIKTELTELYEGFHSLAFHIESHRYFESDYISELNKEMEQIISLSPVIDSGLILNKGGETLAHYPSDLNVFNYINLSDRHYFQKALKTKESYLSDVIIEDTNRPGLALTIPILDEHNNVFRVASFYIRLTENNILHTTTHRIDLGGGGFIYIVDQNGVILSHPDKNRIGEDVSSNFVIRQLADRKSGYEKVIDNEIEMYASYVHIPDVNWGVVAQIPVTSTQEEFSAFRDSLLVLYVFILIPLFFIIGIFTKRMVKPIQELHRAVNNIKKGKLNQEVKHTDNSEIGQLLNNFNEMVKSLKQGRKDLKLKENLLKDQKDFLRTIIDKNPNYIFARNRNGEFTIANKALADLYGTTVKELLGKTEWHLNPNKDQVNRFIEQDEWVIEKGEELFVPEHKIIDSEGNDVWIQITKIPIFSSSGEVEEVLCVSNDLTERMEKEKEIEYQAYHDNLTKLPNRAFFQERLTDILNGSINKQLAIMFLDVDGFKKVNDSLGHSYGDYLLQMIAERLRGCIGEGDMIARMGGDEFTIILPNIDSVSYPEKVAKCIINTLKEPFWVDEYELIITSSIGISVYPDNGTNAETLVKNADTAMYHAKENGKNQYHFFIEEMSSLSFEKLKIESDLRKALQNNEFKLFYQPKLDLQTGEIVGMEGLLRWDSQYFGLVRPEKFIPIAEETGLIRDLGEWILIEGCRQNKLWQDEGNDPLRVALNLSIRQLLDPNFLQIVKSTLNRTGLEPHWLELEITESTLMDNEETVIEILQALKDLGIYISIDDFGTGYSSLSYLKRLPVNALKIDKSFISEIPISLDDQSLTKGIVAMAHSLNLKVIAEGVENEDQVEFLKSVKCDEIQGYFISRPLPPKSFEALVFKEQQNTLI
ncbi:EAL domain-containing protein [Bacillus shivajii]|uniref:bifunctional diguanylate cyclase/phosphodiesterase n=1 Tax=Bacillus shivajii TaxID=1983719 RepID=UPI001CFAE29B|nr:EAL domain-containing protein [Bacillus shivajii]UCZ51460.1 EAL domain-containing protein [Bacillus shivajii]